MRAYWTLAKEDKGSVTQFPPVDFKVLTLFKQWHRPQAARMSRSSTAEHRRRRGSLLFPSAGKQSAAGLPSSPANNPAAASIREPEEWEATEGTHRPGRSGATGAGCHPTPSGGLPRRRRPRLAGSKVNARRQSARRPEPVHPVDHPHPRPWREWREDPPRQRLHPRNAEEGRRARGEDLEEHPRRTLGHLAALLQGTKGSCVSGNKGEGESWW